MGGKPRRFGQYIESYETWRCENEDCVLKCDDDLGTCDALKSILIDKNGDMGPCSFYKAKPKPKPKPGEIRKGLLVVRTSQIFLISIF